MSFTTLMLGYANVLLLSVIVHEVGHLFYFLLHTKHKDVSVRLFRTPNTEGHALKGLRLVVGTPQVYEQLTDKQCAGIYMWGVVAGLLPLFFGLFFSWWLVLAIPVYLYACKKDLKLLFDIYSGDFIHN